MRNFFERLSWLIDRYAAGKHTVFAKKAGIPVSTFQKYLADKMPVAEHLIRIHETYGVSIDWLLTGSGDPSLDSSEADRGVVRCSTNVVELDHADIISRFRDKPFARDLNFDLVELENLNDDAYRKVASYIKGILDGIRMASEQGAGYDEPERRKRERRVRGDPNYDSDRDRRSGSDRRRAVGGN